MIKSFTLGGILLISVSPVLYLSPLPQAASGSSPIAKYGIPTKETIPEESKEAVPDNFSRGIQHGIQYALNLSLVLQDIKSHAEDSDDTAALTDNQEPPIVPKETVDEDIGTNDDVDIRNDGTETLIAEMDDAPIEPPALVPRSPRNQQLMGHSSPGCLKHQPCNPLLDNHQILLA